MKPLYTITALALLAANSAFAYGLSQVDNKVILGLKGSATGAKLKPRVIATQPLAHFGEEYGTGWALTTYRTTITPGGVFPDFTGPGEPLQAFVWSGEVQERRSDTAEAVTLAARSGSSLANGTTGYWENTGDTEAEIYFGVIEPLSEVAGIKPVGVLAHGNH